jgi:hypothetical protein
MNPARFDAEAAVVGTQIPEGLRVAIIGSTSFWHEDSAEICTKIGELWLLSPVLSCSQEVYRELARRSGGLLPKVAGTSDGRPRSFMSYPEAAPAGITGRPCSRARTWASAVRFSGVSPSCT